MTSPGTLLTADDLLRLPDDGRRYELLDGEVKEMAPAAYEHGRVLTKVVIVLGSYVEANDLGEVVAGDPGIILRRNPDRVRAPDVAFFARERVPTGEARAKFVDVVPDLVVEIVSPNDTAAEVQQKVEEWLRVGVRLVLALYPGTRSVVAYQSLATVRVHTETDSLTGEPVLPGFSCPVSSLFG